MFQECAKSFTYVTSLNLPQPHEVDTIIEPIFRNKETEVQGSYTICKWESQFQSQQSDLGPGALNFYALMPQRISIFLAWLDSLLQLLLFFDCDINLRVK